MNSLRRLLQREHFRILTFKIMKQTQKMSKGWNNRFHSHIHSHFQYNYAKYWFPLHPIPKKHTQCLEVKIGMCGIQLNTFPIFSFQFKIYAQMDQKYKSMICVATDIHSFCSFFFVFIISFLSIFLVYPKYRCARACLILSLIKFINKNILFDLKD